MRENLKMIWGNQVRSSTAWSLDRAKKTAEDWINGA